MAELIRSASAATDPRILRSRRMLMDALSKLLTQKDFEEISVQEIAEEATLNRATFYLHYPDKSALLLAMTEARFRNLIERRGISFTDCDGALRTIALGVCDYLTEITNCPVKGRSLPLEDSVIPVVEAVIMEGLSRHELPTGVDATLVATTSAWAIFGAARRWFQAPNRIPAEEMATKIEAMVKPVFLGASHSKNEAAASRTKNTL